MFMNTLPLFLINLDVEITEVMEKDSKSITLILSSPGKRNSPWRQKDRE